MGRFSERPRRGTGVDVELGPQDVFVGVHSRAARIREQFCGLSFAPRARVPTGYLLDSKPEVMIADRAIHSHLTPERVLVGLSVDSKYDLIDRLVRCAATSIEVVDPAALLEDVRRRESRMSTGVGHGLALPHARTDAVSGTVMAVATLSEGIDYDSFDGEQVRIAVLLAGPENDDGGHVRLLSRISRVMARPEFRDDLASARSPEDVLRALSDAEAELP